MQHITHIPHAVHTLYVNTHFTLWHSYTDDHRGHIIADVIRNSDHKTLNTNTPHYHKHLHQISPRCLTHCTTGHREQLNTHYHLTTYPSSPQSTYDMTIDCDKTDEHLQTTRKQTGHNLPNTGSVFAQTTLPNHIHTTNIILSSIILMADKHNIPKGKMQNIHWGPTEEACSMAVPTMSTRPRTSTLRMPSTHPAIRNDNHR